MENHYQDKADAFLFTPLSRYVDDNNNPIEDIVLNKWLVANNKLPEITLWRNIKNQGMFLGVIVDANEQGKVAGKIAYDILIEGKYPSSFSFEPTRKGIQIINLARAKILGLERDEIPSTLLVNSEAIEKFPWE